MSGMRQDQEILRMDKAFKGLWEEYIQRTGLPKQFVLDKVVRWFLAQNDHDKNIVLGLQKREEVVYAGDQPPKRLSAPESDPPKPQQQPVQSRQTGQPQGRGLAK